jgi:hypothetical protein
MINNFKTKFGSYNEVLVVMGDYDKKEHMKGFEPVICKKFRKLFRNAGYETYLVNEHKTSITCSCCHIKLEPFLKRESKKAKGKSVIVYGLLRCTNGKRNRRHIHNRDTNAVKNMLNIVETVMRTGKRPCIFTRTAT